MISDGFDFLFHVRIYPDGFGELGVGAIYELPGRRVEVAEKADVLRCWHFQG